MPEKVFSEILILKEVVMRLESDDIVFATTASYFHQINKTFNFKDFNLHTIILGCLRLALKCNEENRRASEIVMAYYKTIHKDKQGIEIGPCLEKLQKTIRNSELYVARLLKFNLAVDLPYLHLLRIGESLMNWIDRSLVDCKAKYKLVMAMAWSFISDSYFNQFCIEYSALQMAVSALYLALKIENISVYYDKERGKPWFKVISKEITEDVIDEINSKMIVGYFSNGTS